MTQPVNVELGDRSYDIHIGEGLVKEGSLVRSMVAGPSALIVTNEKVAPLYLDAVVQSVDHLKYHVVTLPDGESHKDLNHFSQIIDALVEKSFGRDTTVIALGGGVVGDIAGFAAASYQRGVPFVQIPTTLLAQVDSSVGGKTAVNHPQGKNLIGAFHQPLGVIADISVLSTLDARELKAGLAEVIKYGVGLDHGFLTWIKNHLDDLLALNPSAMAQAIKRSCEIKAGIVKQDEKEQGPRALLNLGHSFGHAIEATVGYGTWLHGEAVAAGMLMAAELSRKHGWISRDDCDYLQALIKQTGLPTDAPKVSKTEFVKALGLDKKNRGNQLRLILLKGLGTAFVSETFDKALLDQLLDETLET